MLLLLAAIWGTGFAFISVALRTLPPATLVAARLTLAAAVLLLAVRLRGVALPRGAQTWARLALLAFVGDALPFLLISWGMQSVASGLTGILMATMPLCTLALAHRFVPGERLTSTRASGFALGFAGVAVLLGPDSLRALGGDAEEILRQLAVLGGAVCYAVNAVLIRRIAPAPPLVSSALTLALAAAMVLPIALALDAPWSLAPSGASLAALAWLALVPTALATLFYFQLVAVAGPTFASLLNFLIPPTAVLAGTLALDERLGTHAYLALGLVTAGLALGQRAARSPAS